MRVHAHTARGPRNTLRCRKSSSFVTIVNPLGADVLALQIREVCKDLVLTHSARQVVEQQIGDRIPEPWAARLPATLGRLDAPTVVLACKPTPSRP